ncbi:DegT/DnrJ/EryC1/StrS aminotransferase family protein [Alphaproteobacteria bacterium]|nr:DegT/DnrJ/EryC1/StrS aminotransferase family protein [Alphaproteobacteria bacterium]MDB2393733.1 DegT/DnrJ/EryC1/StrS aminotransferase family protein [Alphaproteobacteria bacterium]MDB2431931.1 DegT/DnrJ/EryC1/StrS aminotransferase family protein [Alphaproteobacteria bacterium]MDB2575102.1 DegT/DnrJ/EryC1/StrS aminotransferase family protein [Alphaproteobacteria bacterium]MDB2656028.1 DegT/DnrJ/EryC1/StrS aminotransferase family protein [Alphaproteobacteria bacterium]
MINLFQPNLDVDDALLRYKETLESGWLGRGSVTAEFEQVLAGFLGTEADTVHCVSSCTSSIFEICSALGLGIGDTVVIPTNSFPSIPAAIMASGAKLEVVDIDIASGNISIEKLEKFCAQNNPIAVFVTDYGGTPVSVKQLRRVVGPDCFILVDAAASLGTRYKNSDEFIHSEADFVCYSFDAMKLITCGEGGAAVIKNKQLMERFKEFSYLGLPTKKKSGLDVARDDGNAGWWEYDLNCFGRRSVMSDLSAGLGLSQMASIEEKLGIRKSLRDEYENNLNDLPEIKFLEADLENFEVSNYFCTVLTDKRDDLAKFLLENDVYTSFRYWPIHKMNIFQSGCSERNYPGGDDLAKTALNLPIHDGLDVSEITEVCNLIKLFIS